MLTQNDLDQFCGSQNLWKRSSLTYTDGIRFLADQAQCHWLLDAIVSHHATIQQTPRLNEFGIWELTIMKAGDYQDVALSCCFLSNPPSMADCSLSFTIAEDNSATLAFYGDSGEPPAIVQRIPYTDFVEYSDINPLKLYQQNGTLLLPSEY